MLITPTDLIQQLMALLIARPWPSDSMTPSHILCIQMQQERLQPRKRRSMEAHISAHLPLHSPSKIPASERSRTVWYCVSTFWSKVAESKQYRDIVVMVLSEAELLLHALLVVIQEIHVAPLNLYHHKSIATGHSSWAEVGRCHVILGAISYR